MKEPRSGTSNGSAYITRRYWIWSVIWQLFALCGMVSVSIAFDNYGSCGYGFLSVLYSLCQMPKLYRRVVAGEQIPRPSFDSRVPKAREFILWAVILAAMPAGVVYVSQRFILPQLRSPHSAFTTANAIFAETFLTTGTGLLFYMAAFEFRKFIRARQTNRIAVAATMSAPTENQASELPAPSHWWTSNTTRDDISQRIGR